MIADVKQYKELEPIIETSERYRTAVANLPRRRIRSPTTRTRRCAKWPAR